jgi:LPS export ABC transporter protein LptC
MRPQKSTNNFNKPTTNTLSILILSVFFAFFLVACSNDKPDKIAAIVDRTKLPKLSATDITTIISDSGITRYRISAPCWNIYDKANQPYWEFPNGIHFERFDLNLRVDANIHSKYAKFNQNEQIWELRGNVKSTNLQGELFETEQLFWNQRQERFYSDTLIKITQQTRIITGIGFESNQSMTKYMIKRPQGIFPIKDDEATE